MSEISLELLKDVLAKSAIDVEFRAALRANPAEAAKRVGGADLNAETRVVLESLVANAFAIGEGSSLSPADAEIWAVGLLVTSIVRRQNRDWTVVLTDVPRTARPGKFTVQLTDVPRTKKKPKTGIEDNKRTKSKGARKRPASRPAKPK